MKRACIAVVDATKARVFLYQEQTNPGFELVEIRDFDNPGRRLKDSELFSESRPSLMTHGGLRRSVRGGNRNDHGEPGSGSDDHRDAHRDEMDSKFAKLVIDELDSEVRRRKIGHLVLIAEPKMLGTLRAANSVLHRDGLLLEEIDKNLSNLTAPALHDYLSNMELIPPRQRLKAAR